MSRTSLRPALRRAAAGAADLLWPLRCAGCDLPGTLLCDECRTALPIIDPRRACPRCGAPDGLAGCPDCERVSFSFTAARCAGVLEWPLSRAVTLHEDAAELRLTPFLAQLASDAAGEWCGWARAVACVPASPGAYARRGFDHGALLGAAFARVTGVPAIDVLRALPRRDQRLLGRERGRANAGASLVAVPGAFVPARVLVLDDVMTTGATIESAAVALLEAGAAEVRVVAVARACSGNIWAPRSGSPPERRRSPRLPPASMKPLPPGSVVAGLATARPQSKVDAAERTHVSRRATVA